MNKKSLPKRDFPSLDAFLSGETAPQLNPSLPPTGQASNSAENNPTKTKVTYRLDEGIVRQLELAKYQVRVALSQKAGQITHSLLVELALQHYLAELDAPKSRDLLLKEIQGKLE